MKDSKFPCRTHCPINYALEVFGDRWTLLIVRDLMFKGKHYYGDFLASAENMSTNILADRLKRLEKHELVIKTQDATNRSKLLYELTPKGRDLLPIMMELTQWSGKYDARTNAPRALLDSLQRNKEGVIKQIRAGWDTNKR